VASADVDTAPVDWPAYGRYVGGAAVELALQALAMLILDKHVLPRLPANAAVGAVAAWFLFCSFGSRVFSPLDSRRPTLQSEKDAIASRRRPSWMPPPIAFPIVWTTIGVLRTVSSTLVWLAMGRQLLCLPLLAFQAHLSVGDSWNFVNNQERRLGVAVPGVAAVWASAVATTVLYGQVSSTAAWVLLPLPIWLTIAAALVVDIWRLNGGAQRYPLWPTVGSAANEK
jgi:benzodiazapine receptor